MFFWLLPFGFDLSCVPCCQTPWYQYLTFLFVSCQPSWISFLQLCVETFCVFCSASFLTKTVPCGNELHKFLIWDTAGQERVSARTQHMHTRAHHTRPIYSLLSLTHDSVDHISHLRKCPVHFQISRRTMARLSHCECLSRRSFIIKHKI